MSSVSILQHMYVQFTFSAMNYSISSNEKINDPHHVRQNNTVLHWCSWSFDFIQRRRGRS